MGASIVATAQKKLLIGTGRYRGCYALPGSDQCLKVLKPLRWSYRSLATHLWRDINREEIDIWSQIPDSMKSFFPNSISKNGNMLISHRPKDYDGTYSKTIEDLGSISNEYFWDAVDFISEEMIIHKIWLFDVFHLGNNIVVQKITKDKLIPIIIDCKRYGYWSYPLQIHLLSDKEKRKKLLRRLKRFKNKHNHPGRL